jgi:hypothetical protein
MAYQKAAAGTAIVVVAMLLITSALALLPSTNTITHNGTIEAIGVGVYQDSACSQSLSTMNWGTLRPGASYNKTIYVKNLGNVIVLLNMTVTSWNPSNASAYITLTWDRQGSAIAPGNKVQALLLLSVSADVNGFTEFSANTIIAGNQQP